MLKALNIPPAAVDRVFTCALNLLCGIDPNVPVDKKGNLKVEKTTWNISKKCLGDPAKFLMRLNEI